MPSVRRVFVIRLTHLVKTAYNILAKLHFRTQCDRTDLKLSTETGLKQTTLPLQTLPLQNKTSSCVSFDETHF